MTPDSFANARILVVEDERIIARNIELVLDSLGYDVAGHAVSGEGAIAEAEKLRPDLVLMDIVLSGDIDGIDAAKQIIHRLNIPVVYLTAFFDDKKLQRTAAAAPFGYIIKPFKPKELEITIRMALLRHQVENRLKESEERYRDLVEKAGVAITTDDEQGRISYFNKKYAEIFGYTEAEMREIPFQKLIHPDDRKTVKIYHLNRISGKKSPSRYQFRGIHKNGSLLFLEADAVLLKKKGKTIGTRSYIRDITEQTHLADEVKDSREQLRQLAAHLESVRENERTHIAREIHDELGQTLTALKMDLFWLNKRLDPTQEILHEKCGEMIGLTDQIIKTVKKICSELRPGLLDDLGLAAAIEWQAQDFQERMGIKINLGSLQEDIKLDREIATAVFRIFQETLTNIARHSQASSVKVSLKEKNGWLELNVRDNGIGLADEKLHSPDSFGLLGIKERADYFGGSVHFEGVPGKGTAVKVKMPVQQ
jgi:two-component system sensor histidine kinase UhpB